MYYILYYIGDEATSLIFSFAISIVIVVIQIFFNFPPTPLLSTLYNLAPMMKCISGKCELIPAYIHNIIVIYFFFFFNIKCLYIGTWPVLLSLSKNKLIN